MADLRDYTKKNTVFTGTDGIRLPTGNNAQRVASSNVAGTLRFNTDIDGIETYTSAGWRPLAAPPSVSTVTPSTYSGVSGTEFTINGDGFTPDAQVYFVTANGTALLAATVSYYSPVQVRATTPRIIKVEEEPISVRVVQQSGTVTKSNCIDAGGVPSWITTGGALGSIFGANTVNVYVSATDPEGTAVTYQLASGSLPGGLSLSANGLIQGLASSVLANTLYNFVIKANDTVNNNTDRSFSYTVLNRPPVINTAAGSLGTIVSGNVASASISAYDPDGGQITYSVSSGTLPVNSELGSANGTIYGTPVVVTTNTTYSFTITSTDEGSLTASNNYTYTVLNRPPLWNTDATLTSANGDSFTPITVNAYDPDGGVVTYSLTSGSVPSGLTFVSANATITGTAPEVTDNTTSTFTVTATDVGEMGTARTFSLTITPIVDAQFSNTVLLLKAAGNTVIADASSNSLPIAVNGDARASTFSPFNTSWSTYFGAYSTDSYLTYVPGTSVAFGTGDFTVECWAYWDTNPGSEANPYIIDTRAGGGAWAFSWNWTGGSNGSVLAWTKADGNYHQASTQMPLYKWNHCAYVRSGTTGTIYLNGVSILSFTDSTNYSASISLAHLGKRHSGNQANPGYQSNLRIVKGTAVYLSAFTPPTSQLTAITNTVLLTHQAGSFKDNSTANSGTGFTITSSGLPKNLTFSPFEETDTTTGSMFFDGSGDYVLTSSTTSMNLGTNNFCLEFWFYANSVSGTYNGICGSATDYKGPSISRYGSKLMYGLSSTGSSWNVLGAESSVGSIDIVVGQWYHFALCRSGTTISGYLNGRRDITTTSSATLVSRTEGFSLGSWFPGTYVWNGFISNARFVNGSTPYDPTQTTITVPTSPLTAITNTKLLTLQNRLPHNNHSFIDNSRNKLTITRNGNASQGTFTPFSADPGKWGVYFDGSADRISAGSNAAFAFGTGPFCIEFFMYNNILKNYSAAITTRPDNSSYADAYHIGWDSAGGISLYVNTTSSPGGAAGTIKPNLWQHIVCCRDINNVTSLFVDGIRVGTATITSNFTRQLLGIGDFVTTAGEGHNGYMSNVRLVKGSTPYDPTQTTITVPTSPLTAIANTVLLTCQSNRFIDNSNTAATLTPLNDVRIQPFSPFAPNSFYTTANTGGSLYLDGSGDYLLTPSIQNLAFRSGQFTMEAWHYGTTASGGGQLVSSRAGSVNDAATISFYITGGNYSFYGNGNHVSAAYVTGQWNHVVYTRDASSTLRLFINGKLANYEDSFTPDISATTVAIGALTNGGEVLPACWASDIRLVTGSIPTLYQTSSKTNGTQIFTPPTAPLTISSQGALPNTVTMLMNFTDAAIIDYTGKNTIETVGDAKSNNSTYKFSPGSMYFDGTGDYLVLPANKIYDFGTGDFTIECWVRLITINSAKMLVTSNYNAGTGAGGWALIHRADTSSLSLSVNSNVTYTKSWSPTAGIWYHVSVSRSGTNLRFFIDGTQIGTTSTSSDDITGSSTVIVAGNSTSNLPIDANINDLRITKSARYTTNFTAPTRSFPNK